MGRTVNASAQSAARALDQAEAECIVQACVALHPGDDVVNDYRALVTLT